MLRIFVFSLFFSFSLFASSPTSLETKKLSVSFSISANSSSGTHEFHILNGVDVAGYYWKTSNDPEDVPDWSSERYNYRKTGNNSGNLTIINSSGEPTLLELSFSSSTTASCNLSFWSMTNGELVKESYTGTATVTLTDLVLSDVPIEYQVSEPSGYYAPASIAGGTLSAQDQYWPVYDETITFSTSDTFNANITNGLDNPTGTGNYTYTYTGTNSATLSYSIDGAGISFEYDFQFTGENAGIYTKYADYGDGTTDVTTGPFSLSGVAVPEQYVWEDYDDFSGSTLDTTKWDLSCFDGGNLPIISNGEVLLAGKTNSSWNSTIATARMLATNSNAASILAGGGQAHSVLEFKESDNIYGIELSLTLPNNVSTDCGIGLYAIDYNEMFNNGNEEASIRFDLDLWHGSGSAEAQVSWQNPSTGNGEKASSIIVSKGTPIKLAFIRNENEIEFFYNDQSIATGNYQNVNETFFVRAVSETGASFANSVDNVRVLRRSSGSPSIKVAPLALSAFRDKVYLQGQNGPVEIDGASEINFDLQLIGQPTVSAATMTVDSVTYDLASFQAPAAFRTNYGYSSFDDELFDVESSSESDWDPYINGKAFNFNITVDDITYSYAHNLPAESSLPSTPNTSFAESLGWKTDSDGYEYQEARAGNSLTLTWDTFSLASSDDFITVSVEELVGDNEMEVMGSTSLPVTDTSYEFPSSLFESGKKYSLYVAFHKVLESENPTGFEHQTGTNTSQPLLITTAQAVTAVDVVIVDTTPVTVVSDPNGQAVVVQVGNEYQWNSTLDGVTLWSVSESERDGKWSALTAKFSGGNLLYGFEFKDDVADTGNNKVTYQIDENGYIKSLEDDGDYQYYNPVSVENGVVGTIENDQGVDSVANNGINQVDQWFFTTRAAAEEYYYSKVNPKDWMWFDQYPWVYSNEMQEWLYFYSSGGTLMYWSNKGQAWRQFN